MRQLCYFLVFRHIIASRRKIDWKNPTGGLVIKPIKYAGKKPVADMGEVATIFEERYHCGPHEELLIVELFSKNDQEMAWKLHSQWELESLEFQELMELA